MAQFCIHCGAELKENQRFCSSCGAPANPAATPNPQMPPMYPGYPYPPNVIYVPASTPGRGFGIAAIILGAVGVYFMSILLLVLLDTGIYKFYRYDILERLSTCLAYGIFSVMSILAVCFSVTAKRRSYENNVQKSAFILGVIGLGFYLASVIIIMVA